VIRVIRVMRVIRVIQVIRVITVITLITRITLITPISERGGGVEARREEQSEAVRKGGERPHIQTTTDCLLLPQNPSKFSALRAEYKSLHTRTHTHTHTHTHTQRYVVHAHSRTPQ
jgi:hypothetical protein